jgi:hypothetical protein
MFDRAIELRSRAVFDACCHVKKPPMRPLSA